MVRRSQKTIWLFCVLPLLVQSFLPVSAVALVSVRCVGARTDSPPCVQSMIPVGDSAAAGTHLASMPCCRHKGGQSSTKGCPHAIIDGSFSALSAPTCLVTISPLSAERAVATTSARRWMLNASPCLAPPTVSPNLLLLFNTVLPSPVDIFDLPPNYLTDSNGLRAPPIS